MTTIGTPLSCSAKRVMLLGSGELGKEVVIALQRLGVEVIAVDRYDHAPAMQVAHHSYTLDMTDKQAIRQLIEQIKPDLVVPEIEAIATDVLEELEQACITKIVPTARAARLTMDRESIRQLAAETLQLTTSRYAFCSSRDEVVGAIQAGIGFPCLIKPVMSSSGKGQSKLNSMNDVDAAWAYAMAGARVDKQRVIVESFIDFDDEITLLTVRARHSQQQIRTYFCDPIGHLQVNGDYVESLQPQLMSEVALQKAKQMAAAVCENLTLDTSGNALGLGLFGVEFFVKGNNVWFSEVSPRPHDTGLVTLSTQHQSEFELHARAILGLPIDTSLRQAGASAVIYGGMDAKGVVFERIDEALRVPNSDLRLFGKPESFVGRRMGVALAFADHVETARQHAKQAAQTVVVKISS